MKYLFIILVALCTVGCVPEDTPKKATGNPEYRAYISTRMAEAIIDFDSSVDEEVVEELCDGSGWITQGDGHRTECPGCDACEGKGQAPEIEWSDESIQVNDVLEEFEIKADPEPEPEVERKPQPKTEVKKKGPVKRLFSK